MNLSEPANRVLPPIGAKHVRPDILTRAALVLAAVLPWYAVFSGVYGLYSYILVAVTAVGEALGFAAGETASTVLFAVTLFSAIPLALLVLVALPVGAIWAAFRRPPQGLFGKAVRTGCFASMTFCVVYFLIIVGVEAYSITQEEAGGLRDPWTALHAVILQSGLMFTWKAWHWLIANASS